MKRIVSLLLICAAFVCSISAQQPNDNCSFPAQHDHGNCASGFTWGASLTGSVDMGGNDMSAIGIDGYLGARISCMQIIGVGAGINVPVSNSMRSFPLYAVLRTSFTSRPSLCFLDMRGGVSFNYLSNDKTQTGCYMSPGIGIQLAHSKKFSSHLILAYTYVQRSDYETADGWINVNSLHMATLRLGISF